MSCGLLESWSEPSERELIGWKLQSLQRLYGPPREFLNLDEIASPPIHYDFNGDGQREIMVFFSDEGLGDLEIRSINLLKISSVTTCGFALLTRIEDQLWPVFYYYNEYRIPLKYGTVRDTTGLVYESGKGGMQTVWGWRSNARDHPPCWESLYRIWDSAAGSYGPSRIHDKMCAIYGK